MIKKVEIKNKISKLKQTGFFTIFIATIMSKVVTFLGGVILVRILSKSDYGIYAYVNNCFSMLFLLNDFGISAAALQYLTEYSNDSEKQTAILKYSIKSCFIISIAIALIILLSPYFYPYTMDEARVLTPMLFLVPMITIISGLLSIILRANFENKKYSKLQIFITIVTYIVMIIFAVIWGIKGAILSKYVYSIIILLYSIFLTYKYIIKIKKGPKVQKLDKTTKKALVKYSISSELNNMVGSLLLIVDIFLLGYMIPNPETIATYNVASKLPQALGFLSTCIAIYITPYFIKHNKDVKWLKDKFNILIKYSVFGFAFICILLIIFAKPIFYIIFGQQYYEAIPIYIILIIGLFFSSALKYPCSNILGALKKIKVNIITNCICVIANFISNIIFIKIFGIIGAAITTTATKVIVSIVYVIYLKTYFYRMEKENDTEQKRI